MQKITVVNFYSLPYLPNFGGEARIYNLWCNFNENYEIILVNFCDSNSQIFRIKDNFKIINVRRSKLIQRLHSVLNYGGEYVCVLTALDSMFNKEYKNFLKKSVNESKILISEFPYLFPSLQKYKQRRLLIYDAHNVECFYYKTIVKNKFSKIVLLNLIRFIERRTCRNANIIFASSQEDKEEFTRLYNVSDSKIFVAPNGVSADKIKPVDEATKNNLGVSFGLDDRKKIVFIGGSEHSINLNAMEFIAFDLAPKLPEYQFLIIGAVSNKFLEKFPDLNVKIIFPPKIFLNSAAAFGRGIGQYSLFYHHKEKLFLRWSQPIFKIFIRDEAVSKLRFITKYYKSTTAKVYLNGTKIGRLNVSEEWKTFELDVSPVDEAAIKIILDHDLENKGKQEGLTIKEIAYYAKDGQKTLDFKKPPLNIYSFNNIVCFGLVAEEAKVAILETADLAINPMFSGSGTNLKMFDYMAAGLPIVTTEVGARGIEAENRKHLLISPLEKFSYAIEELFQDNNLYATLRTNARELAEEKYDWKKIAQDMEHIIEEKLSKL